MLGVNKQPFQKLRSDPAGEGSDVTQQCHQFSFTICSETENGKPSQKGARNNSLLVPMVLKLNAHVGVFGCNM